MNIDLDSLRKLLRERLCEDVQVVPRPDGALMVRTRFRFPDGPFPDSPFQGPGGRIPAVGSRPYPHARQL